MKKNIPILLLLLSVSVFAQQLNKVYVLSEGGASAGTSTLSMLDAQSNEFTQSIFNPGNIGLFPDGLVSFEGNIYITEQGNFGGSGKIYELDSTGTVLKSAVVGTNPYSLAIANNKIYVTNGPAGNVSVLNLNDFSFVKNIKVGAYPQEIISKNNFVFVANNSVWGGASDSTVSVIAADLDSVISTIVVKLNPSSLAISNDDFLLIGCPGNDSSAVIYKVDLISFAKVDSFSIPGFGFGKDISVDKNSDVIYFKGSTNDIIGLNLLSGDVNRVVDAQGVTFTYGYGYDYSNGVHYLLDAKDFSANGSLITYGSDGALLHTYETGIAPRRLLFDYSNTSTGIETESVVSNFILEQNYPNPFNPTTTIKYSIRPTLNSSFEKEGNTRGVFVTLKVYDILGNEVTALINKLQAPGNYQVQFNASNISSGVYYYTLSAGNYTNTKRMIVLK